MKLVETDFDKTYDELSELNSSSDEEKGRGAFFAGLTDGDGYIDTEAFHRGYDSLIKEEGLEDLFDQEGLLINRGTWGKIKDVKNPILAKGLKRLWSAQFSKEKWAHVEHTKKYYDDKYALYDSLVAYAESINPELLAKLDQQIIAEYEQLSGKKAHVELEVERQKDRYSKDITIKLIVKYNGGWCHFNDDCKDSVVNLDELTKYCNDEFATDIWRLKNDQFNKAVAAILNHFKINYSFNLGFGWETAYFLKNSELWKIICRGDGGHNYTVLNAADQAVDFAEIPEINSLKLVALSSGLSEWSSYAGRGLYGSNSTIYYDSHVDKAILKKCGVTFNYFADIEGPGNGTSRSMIKSVPDGIKATGLDAGEYYSFEHDSTD